MKKLLNIAAEVSDQAEVFFTRNTDNSLSMRNGIATDVSATIQSGYALRILKDGMIGTAYTKNLMDRRELVDNALDSLKGNVQAGFSFPSPSDVPTSQEPDEEVAAMGFSDLHSRSKKVLNHLRDKVEGQLDITSAVSVSETAVMNTNGLDVSSRIAVMMIFASLLFPNTETGVRRLFVSKTARDFPEDQLDDLMKLYKAGLPKVDIPSGKMDVMFTPDSMYTLLWRLSAASSGRAFYNKISPLLNKRGEKVLSEKFTVYGDPTSPEAVNQRFFDDEGVPTGKHVVFEKGVFRNLILNLDYARRLDEEPTGTGYRGGMWGGETVSMAPSPSLASSAIAPGDRSLQEMISSMERGVIVLGVLGAHSGNILNGDFSVGLNPGFYVEDGEIKGRVNDGMVAGNVYDALNRIKAVEDRQHFSMSGGRYPAILLESVSVAAK